MKAAGVQSGDRVAGFLPNLPETVIAMLATTSLGAIWSSCSPDFGTQSVVDRLGQIKPRVLFCTDSYQYNGKVHDCLERVREIALRIPAIEQIVVVPYLEDEASSGGIEAAVGRLVTYSTHRALPEYPNASPMAPAEPCCNT